MTDLNPNRTGFKRVMLKLGGEMFGGGKVGIDPDVVESVARQIADVARSGTEVAVVIGGGNFFRGAQLQQRGMDRARSDYMGMLGTPAIALGGVHLGSLTLTGPELLTVAQHFETLLGD